MGTRMFASDNSAPACPEVIDAIASVGEGHCYSYGNDPVTANAGRTAAALFGLDPDDFILAFVPNGTAANVIGLSAFLRRWDAVVAGFDSHLTEDECGALEALAGIKIDHRPGAAGKIGPESVAEAAAARLNLHRSDPRAVSITQTTELGTCYSIAEIRAIGEAARAHEMILHVDGARIANAVHAAAVRIEAAGLDDPGAASISPRSAQLSAFDHADPAVSADSARCGVECDPGLAGAVFRAMTVDAGVGILSLGMTKNGGAGCDALAVFPANLPEWARYGDRRPWPKLRLSIARAQKQSLGLFSKSRYAAVQLNALLEGSVWLRNAGNSNTAAWALARSIAAAAAAKPNRGMEIRYPVQANGIWLSLPEKRIEELRVRFGFYVWEGSVVRLMTSWDTRPEDVAELAYALESIGT